MVSGAAMGFTSGTVYYNYNSELDSWLQACYSEQSKTTRAEMVR